MTIITGFIEVSKSYAKTHPTLNFGKDWFGSSKDNQSFSLNGGKVNSIEFGELFFSLTSLEMKDNKRIKKCDYWSKRDCVGVDAYHIYLGLDSFEDTEKAFKHPVYELSEGVLLHLSGKIANKPTSYKEIAPID